MKNNFDGHEKPSKWEKFENKTTEQTEDYKLVSDLRQLPIKEMIEKDMLLEVLAVIL